METKKSERSCKPMLSGVTGRPLMVTVKNKANRIQIMNVYQGRVLEVIRQNLEGISLSATRRSFLLHFCMQ